MEKIVYLLGAGFSAPLGVPTVKSFLDESRRLSRDSSQSAAMRECLKEALSQIDEHSKHLGRYFEFDFKNIEEMLSIIEMALFLGKSGTQPEEFKRFLNHVIRAKTPVLEKHEPNNPLFREGGIGNWSDHLFSGHPHRAHYAVFVASLFNLRFNYQQNPSAVSFSEDATGNSYSAITLNYDNVVENLVKGINSLPPKERTDVLDLNLSGVVASKSLCLNYAKVHGTVVDEKDEAMRIVMPTWNKTSDKRMRPVWQLASALLAEATQLRIVGYSLPESDAYIRYLLMASMSDNPALERVDIICKDRPTPSVAERYKRFIRGGVLRFKDAKVEEYLKANWISVYGARALNARHLACNRLEIVHEDFMSK
jgi:hypothetical protein